MTIENEASRARLADLIEFADVQAVLGWRRSPTNWRLERLQIHGDLPDDFRRIAGGAAGPLLDEDIEVLDYNPDVALAEGQAFLLANDPPLGGDLFPQLDAFANMSLSYAAPRPLSPSVGTATRAAWPWPRARRLTVAGICDGSFASESAERSTRIHFGRPGTLGTDR